MNLYTYLCDLAYKYGSDKCYEIKHPFTEYYFDLFNPIRYEVQKVLELGVGYPGVTERPDTYMIGASLRMWRDFFPNAHIHGLDILERVMFEDDRITTHLCDQTDIHQLSSKVMEIGSDIDIVIDDGLHTPKSQLDTCLTIMPLIKKDAIYVIEDLVDSSIITGLGDYDARHIVFEKARYFDDQLIVVRNKK